MNALCFSILFGMRTKPSNCRRPQRGGFFRESILIMIAVAIFTVFCLTHSVDPRKAEIDRLTSEYNKAWSDLTVSLATVDDPIVMIKKHNAVALALKKLREAKDATPPELVSDAARRIAESGL